MVTGIAEHKALDRNALLDWYRRNRERSRALFDMLGDEAYYTQPIALRHPIVFYEGHLPGFSFNTFIKKALGGRSIDPALERLFARGIDPHESSHGESITAWPKRAVVREFAEEADRRVLEAIAKADIERPGDPFLDRAAAVFTVLEHEAMHQETLLYMWHRLPFEQKRRPAGYQPVIDNEEPQAEWIDIPAGRATLGADRDEIPFGWDNEFPACTAEVGAFRLERHDVTNGRYLEFVMAGGYDDERWWRSEDWQWLRAEGIRCPLFWEPQAGRVLSDLSSGRLKPAPTYRWRGMFDLVPLPLAWPVYVSHAEASAYARWRGCRLMTEAEFQRASYGTPEARERRHPWGNAAPTHAHGVFDFESWDPQPAGRRPGGRSAWGVDDLVGNGWEWTSTPFAPFPGFSPMASYPEYSADFFDGEHFVMKGASPATARELLRPTFRNWFRARYPYVYATFRCARDAANAGAGQGGRRG
jgi:ergothioneine biosynthesis protein EgtB